MSKVRKFQLMAVAVITNGVIVLGCMSPKTALAATCGTVPLCVIQSLCQGGGGQASCIGATPPGCTFNAAICLYPNTVCGPSRYTLLCNYK
jgi:hypothetical protein